jgi:hypothetical protein
VGGGAGAGAGTAGGAGSGGSGGGGSGDGGATDAARADGGATAGMAKTKLLVGRRARLVGGPVSACSQPPGNGDRWCAFTLPGTPVGTTELWSLNVSKAIPADVPCDGTSPACVKVTGALWTGTPDSGVVHPLAHHFDGETLIFYVATSPITAQAFTGPVHAWRPGWPQGKQLSGANGYSCEGHERSDAALCIEDVHLEAKPPYFDVHAGRVNGSPLPLAARVYPSSPTNARQWSMAFSPAGDYFAWSTGGATAAEKETLYVSKIDEVGMAAKRLTVGAAAQWDISTDGKRWYWLRDYNYPPRGTATDPAGTLMTAEFPSGANPTMVATQVGSYVLLGEANADRGVAFLDQLAAGKGSYKFLRDASKPAEAVTLAKDVVTAVVSPDLRYSLLQTQYGASADVGDAVILKNDGTGRCMLSAGTSAGQFGAAFLPGSGRVLWADKVDPMTLEGEGWLGNPDGCTEKQKFGDRVDFWFLAGDAGFVFSDSATTSTSTLRFAKLGAGGLPADGPTTVRAGVGRVYAPLGLDREYVVFQIGDGGADDGIYVYGPIGFGK